MDDSQRMFTSMICFDLSALDEGIEGLGFPEIRGLQDFINTIRNGRCIDSKKERFYGNLLQSLKAVPDGAPKEFADHCPIVLGRTLDKFRGYVDDVSVNDPIGFHSRHLKLMNQKDFNNYISDQTVARKRINELFKTKKLELAMPALKDQYILVFEKMYMAVYEQLQDIFGELMSRDDRYLCIEDIMSIERTRTSRGAVKSDVRVMRNMFAHPDRIDMYDYYHLCFDDGTIMDLDAEKLNEMTVLLSIKTAVVQFLARVVFDLRLYQLEFEKEGFGNPR